MGMKSDPQTWLYIKSKMSRECLKKKKKSSPISSTSQSDYQIGTFEDFLKSNWGDSDASTVFCEALP